MSNRLAIVMCVLIGFLSSCSVGPTAATPEVEPDDRAIETTASTIPTKTVKPSVTPSPTQTLNPSATPKPSPTLTTTPIIVGPFHQVFLDEPLPHDIASIIHISEDGTVWLGTEKDIVLLKDFTWDVYLQDFPGELIGVDEAKRVWVVDQNGSSISAWDGNSWNDYTAAEGWMPLEGYSWISSHPVMDQLGQVWLFTDMDLRVFNGQVWDLFTHADLGISHPLAEEEGLSPYLYPKPLKSINELWIGTCNHTGAGPIGGQGVLRYDGHAWRQLSAKLSSGCTEAIVEDHEGSIWIGLDEKIWRYDPSSENITELKAPPYPFEGSGFFNQVLDIVFDPANNPWAEFLLCGGAGCGYGPILYRFDEGAWVLIVTEDFQYNRKLVFDPAGTPWLLTPAGIFKLAEGRLDQVAELRLNPDSVTEDELGNVWFIVVNDEKNELWTTAMETPTTEPPTTSALYSSADCSATGESVSIEVEDLLEPGFEKRIAAYLNARGSANGLQSMLTSLSYSMLNLENPEKVKAEVITRDVTGDINPEILVSITIPYGNGIGETTFSTYRCYQGQYIPHVLFARRGAGSAAEGLYSGGGVKIVNIRDVNLNSFPEILFSVNWPSYAEYYIGEWREDEFISLIPRYLGPGFEWISRFPINTKTDLFQIEENTGDHLDDFVIIRPHECSDYAGNLPLRTRTETWSWNGEAYYPSRIEYSPPAYRFQAAVDGDNATRAGDYAAALEFYQQAISDEQLDENWPIDNPLHRNVIEAYARYRMMLLHTVQSQLDAAETVYEYLLKNFPEETVGHEYAALAKVFWESLLNEGDFESACKSTKEHAIANGISLTAPFSDGFYEIEDFANFIPKDICSNSIPDE